MEAAGVDVLTDGLERVCGHHRGMIVGLSYLLH